MLHAIRALIISAGILCSLVGPAKADSCTLSASGAQLKLDVVYHHEGNLVRVDFGTLSVATSGRLVPLAVGTGRDFGFFSHLNAAGSDAAGQVALYTSWSGGRATVISSAGTEAGIPTTVACQ